MRKQRAEQVLSQVRREMERLGFYKIQFTLARNPVKARHRSWLIKGHTDGVWWEWTMFVRPDLVKGAVFKPIDNSTLGVYDLKQ